MSGKNQRDDLKATAATVAIGAALGFGAYKLYETFFSANEPHSSNSTSNSGTKQPRSIKFRSSLPRSFPSDSKMYVIDNVEECRYAIRELKSHCDEYNVLGFDCEWKLDQLYVRQNVALVQLASHRGLCVLIRLCELKKIPSELQELLEDGNIIKVGVTPLTDAQYLFQDYRGENVNDCTRTRNTLDLRFVANLANHFDGSIGLANLSEKYLGVTLEKSKDIRCSDWNALQLNAEQIEYAAKDALVAIELFKLFAEKIEPSGAFRSQGTRLKSVIDKCSEYFDTKYKEMKVNQFK